MSDVYIYPSPRGFLARLVFALAQERIAGAPLALWLWSGGALLALYLCVALPFVIWPEWCWPGRRYDADYLGFLASVPDPSALRAAEFVAFGPMPSLVWASLLVFGGLIARASVPVEACAYASTAAVLWLGLLPSSFGLDGASFGCWMAAVYFPALSGFFVGSITSWRHLGRRHPPRLRSGWPTRFFLGLLLACLAAIHPGLAAAAAIGFAFWFAMGFYRPATALAYALIDRGRPATFADNPYCFDGRIRCSLPAVRRRQLALAARAPDEARAFAAFLRDRRPLQSDLAKALERAAGAGR